MLVCWPLSFVCVSKLKTCSRIWGFPVQTKTKHASILSDGLFAIAQRPMNMCWWMLVTCLLNVIHCEEVEIHHDRSGTVIQLGVVLFVARWIAIVRTGVLNSAEVLKVFGSLLRALCDQIYTLHKAPRSCNVWSDVDNDEDDEDHAADESDVMIILW